MPHPRIKSRALEWHWDRGPSTIQLRVVTDLELDPGAKGYDRKLVDDVMRAILKERGDGRGVIQKIVLVGSPPT